MEKLVDRMLTDGLIWASTSPFSSSVLLVKKKDGTWHFCINCLALNTIKIKDHFLIATVDELLNKLALA